MNGSTIAKTNKVAAFSIIAGIILYLSKYLRVYFTDNAFVTFVLGFLPNFGLSFAIPFVYVSNRVRQKKAVKHFPAACLVTLVLMILNEIRDKYQPGRTFDMFDIYASFAGVLAAYLLFRFVGEARTQKPGATPTKA